MSAIARPSPPRARRMTLGSVTDKPTVEPDRIFIYGPEKVGKSTFGACAPKPIFISAERGLAELSPPPAHFPEAETFQDVLDAVEELTTGQHDFKTLAVDSLDWIEQMIAVAVCARCRRKDGGLWTMEDFAAYGQGQKVAVEDWRKFLLALDRLQTAKGMEVILIAHATTKTFDDPTGAPYTRFEPQMAGNIGPKLVKQWAKAILFARHEYSIRVGEGFGKAKGSSTGRRVLHTQWSAAYDAGTRYEMPAVIDLDYAAYAKARDGAAERLYALALDLLGRAEMAEDARPRYAARLASIRSDAPALSRAVDALTEMLPIKEGA